LVFLLGCGSTQPRDELTSSERTSIKSVIFIAGKEAVSESDPTATVRKRIGGGTTVRILGRGGEMSLSSYKSQRAEAVKGVEYCLSKTYGNKKYSPDRFKLMVLKLVAKNNPPFQIKFVSEAEQNQFNGLSKEDKPSFIKTHNADAVLYMRAYHKAGLDPIGRGRSIITGYSGLYAEIDDHKSDKEIYFSGYTFTGHLPVRDNGFCEKYIYNFEHAIDEQTTIWFEDIIGFK
jgi:hypothetical protein